MKAGNFCAGGWGHVKVDDLITSIIDGGSVVAFVGAEGSFTNVVARAAIDVNVDIVAGEADLRYPNTRSRKLR